MIEKSPQTESLLYLLKHHKAENVVLLDVRNKSQFADYMIISTGRSRPHVHALAKHLKTYIKSEKLSVLSVDANSDSEWVLVDLGNIVIHIMLAETRDFYQIEALWSSPTAT